MSVGDFIAMQDVLNGLAEDSDSLSADEAIAALEALGELASVLKRTESMVETALRRHLEGGSRELGGRMYGLGKKGEWRFRHRDVIARVAEVASTPNVDGEVPTARDAAISAARTMLALYASDSTKPKATALKALGFHPPAKGVKTDVADWEKTGTEIKVVDLDAPEGA